MTLQQLLETQDLNAEKIAKKVNDGEFDIAKDPLTAVIINAYENSEGFEGTINDLDYAITQLKKAKERAEYYAERQTTSLS